MSKRPKLTILDQINIPKPCHEDWTKMEGDERNRHCKSCNHCVVNLSEHSKKEAAEILAKNSEKRLCVRYIANSDGSPRYKKTASIITKMAACISALYYILPGTASVSADCATCDNASPQEERRELMGEMMPAPTPTAAPEVTQQATMGIIAAPEIIPTPDPDSVVMGKVVAPKSLGNLK